MSSLQPTLRSRGNHESPIRENPRNESDFLRAGISLLEDVAQRLGPPLEIGENALLVALLVVGGAGIGIVHPVTQGVIEEHRDLTGSGGDGLGLADTR